MSKRAVKKDACDVCDVCIDIKSTQFADAARDITELFTFGTFAKAKGRNPNCYSINYDESEATGFTGNSVSLSVDGNDLVVMNRIGSAASSLVIERGRKHHCHYGTPYGDFMVGITASEIRSDLCDGGGHLYLKYTVDINSSFMSENEMFINVKERAN